MKKLLFILLFPLLVLPQEKYSKNSHVEISVQNKRSKYKIEYIFKDHFERTLSISLVFKRDELDNAIAKFGIPSSMFDTYSKTKEVLLKREQILSDGLYKKEGKKLVIDRNAVVSYYRPYFKHLAKDLIKLLKRNKEDTRLNRIEIAMKFVQDIPYGIPDESYGEKYDDGCFAPPEVLIEGYGDCDSKTYLFICILSHMINPNDIIFIHGDNHLLSAVRSNKVSAGKYFTYKEKKYYLCETAGPGRPKFGKKNSSLGHCTLYPLNIKL